MNTGGDLSHVSQAHAAYLDATRCLLASLMPPRILTASVVAKVQELE